MMMSRALQTFAFGAVLAFGGFVATITAASAAPPARSPASQNSEQSDGQWLWDWGGEQQEVDGAGREVVKFDPTAKPGQIFVSYADRRLYYVTKQGEATAYPIAIPRQQDLWEGVMKVTDKKVNPSWTPTADMIKENPRLPSWVPGGHPMNPLGVRALYLGSSAYRIHGTDAPWTIGQPVSKGCIRMYNKDVIDLYEKVPVGTQVTVTWKQFRASTS